METLTILSTKSFVFLDIKPCSPEKAYVSGLKCRLSKRPVCSWQQAEQALTQFWFLV
jgi:hypothetical protein